MKKLFSLIIALIISSGNIAVAEGDLWDNFGDQNYYGTKKYVTDKDFRHAIDIKKGEKKPKKKKGDTYHQGDETNVINQIPTEYPIVCINTPVKIGEDAVLPIGHYQVMSEKRANKIYLKLYQGHYLITELEAIETLDDFDEPEINFANFITDGNIYKLIYGSIDYNAYVNLDPVIEVEE